MAAVASQLKQLPADVDLVVLSIGGNDAMTHVDLLEQPTKSSGDTLDALVGMVDDFAAGFDPVAKSVRDRSPRLVVCTIYEPPLVGLNTASRARVLLTLLNDHILRTAYRWGLDVLDLRAICTIPEDFTQQIAPSATGAAKIGRAMKKWLNRMDLVYGLARLRRGPAVGGRASAVAKGAGAESIEEDKEGGHTDKSVCLARLPTADARLPIIPPPSFPRPWTGPLPARRRPRARSPGALQLGSRRPTR